MAAAIASGLIRQKRQAREQHAHRPTAHRRRKSPGKKQGLCNGNLVDIFSKVRIFGLKKRRLRRQGVHAHAPGGGGYLMHRHARRSIDWHQKTQTLRTALRKESSCVHAPPDAFPSGLVVPRGSAVSRCIYY